MRDENTYDTLVVAHPVKRGRGQRKSRRDKAGRRKHAEHTKREMRHLAFYGKVEVTLAA